MARGFRTSVAAVLGLVLVSALGFAGLRSASGYWAAATVTATVMVLLTSVIGACKGRNRTAWLGFAVFGWGYFAFGLGPWFRDDLRAYLLTSAAVVESYDRLHKSTEFFHTYVNWPDPPEEMGLVGQTNMIDTPQRFVTVVGAGPAVVATVGPGPDVAVWGSPDYFAFERTAHALFALLSGVLGSIVAAWFEMRSLRGAKQSEGAR